MEWALFIGTTLRENNIKSNTFIIKSNTKKCKGKMARTLYFLNFF